MKKKNENQTDRLAELLGTVDSALLDEALKTDTPEALAALSGKNIPAVPQRSRVWTRSRVHALVASAAVVTVLALVLPVALRLAEGLRNPSGNTDPWESTQEDPYVAPSLIPPPWVSGDLKLSTLTYGGKTDTAAIPYPTLSLLNNTAAETDPLPETDTGSNAAPDTDGADETETAPNVGTDTSAETETAASDPIYGLGENYAVSILPNMKITDYLEGGLIKLRPDSGEHMRCPDVYYDIEGDAYICLSCKVGELLMGSDIYAEAALSCLIDECLLYYSPLMGAGMMQACEREYRNALSSSDFMDQLAQKKKITKSALSKLDFYDEGHREFMKEQIGAFEYPIVDVVEYGADLDRCIVTLVSPRTGMGYGNFLCDLTAGTLTSLDGRLERDQIPNLSLATSVVITENYRTAVITVPYFGNELRKDPETGLFTPLYTSSNIFLYDLHRMTCTSLAEGNVGYRPATEGVESMGVVTYKGIDSTFYAFYRGVHYALPGAPLRICRDINGNRYAAVASGDGYAFYRLTEADGSPLVYPDVMEGKLDMANRYVLAGHTRVDLISGETVTLWEGTPAAQTLSRDGRCLYLYFEGETDILCVDVWAGLKGRVSLSEDFLAEAMSAGEITYRLLLSHSGDQLLMSYFEPSTVAFDAESFMNVPLGERHGREETVADIINHFTVNGKPLRFYEKSRAILLAKLLFLPDYMDWAENGKDGDWKQICLEVGERMIPYLDVWATSAEVPASVVSEKLGNLSADQFDELFMIRYNDYDHYLHDEEKLPSEYGTRRDYALNGYSRGLRDALLKYCGVTPTEENQAYLDALIHGYLDAAVSQEVTISQPALEDVIEEILLEVSPTLMGCTYAEFLQRAGFFGYPIDEVEYHLTTDSTMGDIRLSGRQRVDQNYVRAFLSGVSFTEGEVEIRVAARIVCPIFIKYDWITPHITLVELGYAADGRAYVVSNGLYAEITPEDVETFKTEAVSKQTQYAHIVVDRPW